MMATLVFCFCTLVCDGTSDYQLCVQAAWAMPLSWQKALLNGAAPIIKGWQLGPLQMSPPENLLHAHSCSWQVQAMPVSSCKTCLLAHIMSLFVHSSEASAGHTTAGMPFRTLLATLSF
jgi:hypothetical protein